jgi:hypothetical protein
MRESRRRDCGVFFPSGENAGVTREEGKIPETWPEWEIVCRLRCDDECW